MVSLKFLCIFLYYLLFILFICFLFTYLFIYFILFIYYLGVPLAYPTTACYQRGLLKNDPYTYTTNKDNGRVF